MDKDNWLDKLAALRDTMPDSGPEEEQPAVAEQTKDNSNGTAAQRGRLDIVYERKGRNGKAVTIIVGVEIDDDALADLASEMKRRLGTGGSVSGGEILVQGDRRQDVLRFLTDKGFKARVI